MLIFGIGVVVKCIITFVEAVQYKTTLGIEAYPNDILLQHLPATRTVARGSSQITSICI